MRDVGGGYAGDQRRPEKKVCEYIQALGLARGGGDDQNRCASLFHQVEEELIKTVSKTDR